MKLYLKNGKTIRIKKDEAKLIMDALQEINEGTVMVFLKHRGVRYASITISEIAAIY